MINSRAKGAKIILLLTKILCSRLYYRNYRVSVKRSKRRNARKHNAENLQDHFSKKKFKLVKVDQTNFSKLI